MGSDLQRACRLVRRDACVGGLVLYLIGWVTVAIPVNAAEAVSASAEAPKIHVVWKGALVEEAVLQTAAAAEGKARFLCDSYDPADQRHDNPGVDGTVTEVARIIGKEFQRAVIQMDELYVFQHDRWYDLGFAGARTREAERRPRGVWVTRVAAKSEKKESPTIDIRVIRTSVEKLAQAVQKATGEKHLVQTTLVRRQVTGLLPSVTTERFRAAVAALFPDSEWVRHRSTWVLREKPNAQFVRAVAADPGEWRNSDRRTRIALAVQLAGDLSQAQLEEMRQKGALQLSWGQMSPRAQQLILQYAASFHEVMTRSGNPREAFPDLAHTADLGVKLQPRPGGLFKVWCLGRTLSGPPIQW
jgi:hypothetical protein